MTTNKKNLKEQSKLITRKNPSNKKIREHLLDQSIPNFISQNSVDHDVERFLKFAEFYKHNEDIFKSLTDDELGNIVGVFSMKISEERELEIGIDTFISNLISAVQRIETEEQLEDRIINDADKVRDFGIEPDYSVKSLKQLGKFLWKESMNIKNDSFKATQIIMPSAAYLGEVIRRNTQKNYRWISYEEAAKKGLKDEKDYFNLFVLYAEPEVFIQPIYSVYTVVHGENDKNHLETVYQAVISKFN